MGEDSIVSTMQVEPLTIREILVHGSTWNANCRVWTLREAGHVDETSFGEVSQAAEKLAHGLASLGVTFGDRVGTYMWNTAEHLAAYFAVPAMGAVLHTANIRLSAEQNRFTINKAGDRVLLVDSDLLPDIVAQLPQLPNVEAVIVNGDADLQPIREAGREALSLADLLERSPGGYDWPAVDELAAASICFTTGTTGDPKGVVYSHRSTWLHSLSLGTMNALRLGADDCALIAVPMFHANAWGYPFAAFWTGADMVLPNRFVQPAVLVDLIERFQVTFANGVPTIWTDVLRYLEEHPGHDISSVDRLVVGGAAASVSLIETFETLYGVSVLQGWGMTESSPLASAARPPRGVTGAERMEYRATQGRVLPGVQIRLTDPDSGDVLPADGVAVGEFELRGPWISGSYLGGDGAEKFRDGWLRTGDVGTLDPQGYVRLSDRSKDIIKSGGEWISSVALENMLAGHPHVQDVAVIGVPDQRWDERPCVIAVLRQDADVDANELRSWLADRVQRWWLPERWAFAPVIPRTSVGKTDKKLLRQMYAKDELLVVTLQPPAKVAQPE
jgi:fatty-acyl-CoA synthase